MQQRAEEELLALQRKVQDLNAEAKSQRDERVKQKLEFQDMKKQIDVDKQEFATYVSQTLKMITDGESKLKEEENRLNRIREKVASDSADLEKRKTEVLIIYCNL
jgi:hypothetical protein